MCVCVYFNHDHSGDDEGYSDDDGDIANVMMATMRMKMTIMMKTTMFKRSDGGRGGTGDDFLLWGVD